MFAGHEVAHASNFAKWPFFILLSSSYVPSSTTLPWCRTTILLHFLIVLNLCAITIDVLPFIASSKALDTISWLYSSSADVASSKINIFGFLIKALAIAILCFYPPDSLLPLRPQILLKPSGSTDSVFSSFFLSIKVSN